MKRLAKAPSGLDLTPDAWSPDGRAVVYTEYRGIARPFVRVVRGGRVRRIAVGSLGSWSRRGVIAYAPRHLDGALSQVCLTSPRTGGGIRCLGSADVGMSSPTWSPNGRRLMVAVDSTDRGREIWTMRPDGTVLTRAPQTASDAPSPVFSPDGRALAFNALSFRGDPRLGYYDLYAMLLDGTGRRQLVAGGQAQRPDWQPRPVVVMPAAR